MKLILFLLFLSNISFAKTYAKKDQISCENIGTFYSGPKALQLCGENCAEVKGGFSCEYSAVIPETQMKQEVESCLDEADCQAKHELKSCKKGKPIKNLDLMEVYCTYLRPEHVGIDQAKKNAHDALKAQEEAQKNALSSVYKDMDFGKELYAKIMLMNKGAGLTKAQRKQMRKDLKDIKDDLSDGNICDARSEIALLAINPPIITQERKDAVLSLIDGYKVCE
jgi:hypothetical protein